jgi:hypothetical protein
VGDQIAGLPGINAGAAGDSPHRRTPTDALEDQLVYAAAHRSCGFCIYLELVVHLKTSFGWALCLRRRGARLTMEAKAREGHAK